MSFSLAEPVLADELQPLHAVPVHSDEHVLDRPKMA
jgi:hypothetical protein